MKKKNSPPLPEDQSARIRVLAAATRLFTQRGYAAASVREIVGAAGVTKPILYYYFGNKEGIYLEILNGVLRKFNQLVEEVRKYEGSPRENIIKFGNLFYRGFKEHLAEARLIHAIYYGPQQGAPPFDYDLFHAEFEKVVRLLVNKAVRSGEFKPQQAEFLVWTLLAAINFANESQLINSHPPIGETGLARMLHMIMEGASHANIGGRELHRPIKLAIRREGRKRNAGKRH
jgi:TetR/AcrR family transcriptional regulator